MTEELENKATEWIRSQGWSEENLPNDEYIQMCDAYVAGAKENGVIWHDLRENPNDLPKEFSIIKKAFGIYPEEKYIHTVLNQDGEYVHCLHGEWYYFYDEDTVGDSPKADVIAWCEIPKFDKLGENEKTCYKDSFNDGLKLFEQEKCELLEIIQKKNELIEKMKCSKNCQTWNEWQCPYARNKEKNYVYPNKNNCPCDKWKMKVEE